MGQLLAITLIIGGSWLGTSVTPTPRVLVLGDSHANGTFGTHLHEQLRTRLAADVTVIGSCGRWSRGWVEGLQAHCGLRWVEGQGETRWGKGCRLNPCDPKDKACRRQACRVPRIQELLAQQRPDLTIVQLGGNSWFRGSRKDQWKAVAPWVDKLSTHIVESGCACLWVSPPHGLKKSRRQMRHFHAFLAKRLDGRCALFDSGPKARPWLDYAKAISEATPGARSRHDEIHYDRLGKPGWRRMLRWAKEIAETAADVLPAPRPVFSRMVGTWLERVADDLAGNVLPSVGVDGEAAAVAPVHRGI